MSTKIFHKTWLQLVYFQLLFYGSYMMAFWLFLGMAKIGVLAFFGHFEHSQNLTIGHNYQCYWVLSKELLVKSGWLKCK